ncbi:hypothetical protein FMUND_3805 [Fusarium mundagurra]|uniref:Uncharacterized protein n=1 Tax=Fusarium mundagurra TaxID=1567541 RepID=A0A8H5YYY1_9HYPO|nr:hypothetical protein FMUND_3805 [Fusarium mundagurra]
MEEGGCRREKLSLLMRFNASGRVAIAEEGGCRREKLGLLMRFNATGRVAIAEEEVHDLLADVRVAVEYLEDSENAPIKQFADDTLLDSMRMLHRDEKEVMRPAHRDVFRMMVRSLQRAIKLHKQWNLQPKDTPPEKKKYWVDEMLKVENPTSGIHDYFNRMDKDLEKDLEKDKDKGKDKGKDTRTPLQKEYAEHHRVSVGHLPSQLV